MANVKKISAIAAGVVLVAGAAFWGVRAWRMEIVVRQERRAFNKAAELVRAGKPSEALALLRTQTLPDSTLAWPGLEVEALVGLRDVGHLVGIYERGPARILANEEASVLVARAYMQARRAEPAEEVRAKWRGREKRTELWLVYDSDALLVAGRAKDAETLLRTHPQRGTADVARLTRLAILVARRDVSAAFQLLGQAAALDSRDADVRLFRGQVLEAVGKVEAARYEYVAAALTRTNDAFVRDELAEFYRRQGNIELALDTWIQSMPDRAPDYFWLKAGFWSRVVQTRILEPETIAEGGLQPLAQWLIQLPSGVYFDTNSFALLAQSRRYTTDRQEIFWLQLIDNLQRGREQAAFDLLSFNRFRVASWNPDLESALIRILHYRLKRSLNPTTATLAASEFGDTNRHRFFIELGAAARAERLGQRPFVDAALDSVLRGPEAFAAAFMAAGWREAALNLRSANDDSGKRPMWLAYGLAQLLRSNRSPKAALEFLNRQGAAPELELLTAETLLQTGENKAALALLKRLAAAPSPVGLRASYILALADLDRGLFDAVSSDIERQPLLATNVLGQELLGRLALRRGQTNEADRIFLAIADKSIEAKAHLARRAFAQKQWKDARQYTTDLLTLLPDRLQLRENLLAIDREEAGR